VSPKSSQSSIAALVDLLLDEEPGIRAVAVDHLVRLGEAAVSELKRAADGDDARLRLRAREVLGRIAADRVAAELRVLAAKPEFDLEEACLLLARLEKPDLDGRKITARLDELSRRLAARLAKAGDFDARARALGQVIAKDGGFGGNTKAYYDPRNSYLDEVLERKVGIPISLTALYILVGRRSGLSLRGVGMPLHFLLSYEDGGQSTLIDPFRDGNLTTRENCRALLAGQRHSFREDYLKPVSDRDLFRRMLANLVHIYNEKKDAARLTRLLGIVSALQGGKS